jgi:hypothetical protein
MRGPLIDEARGTENSEAFPVGDRDFCVNLAGEAEKVARGLPTRNRASPDEGPIETR